MITLGIDTANQTMAIGLIEENVVLGQIQTNIKRNHSITLMPAIDQLFSDVQKVPEDIDRIAVSQGPGSYTGLRIGVTTAKTLAYTLKKELVGVSSLATLAANCIGRTELIIPLFDARRKNVYAGMYRFVDGQLVQVVEDAHRSIQDVLELAKSKHEEVYFVGEDCAKFLPEITASLPDAKINEVPEWNLPSGVVLAQLGAKLHPIEDISGFLPHYLKRVEAEEKWLETHTPGAESYVEKI
ncbi:MAG: tRNA (adenosine(37)-N6)-threonylcarbamoyltransferase complex dimerization subunit type 1 TsaB [Enterococcus sp.]